MPKNILNVTLWHVPVVALAGLLAVTAIPSYADTIVSMDMSNITFAGNDTCSPSPCKDTFNASWKWDATTGTLVLGSVDVSNAGSLGNDFQLVYWPGNPSENTYSFQFFESPLYHPDATILWYFDQTRFPAIGTYNLSEAYLYCSLGGPCASDFTSGYSQPTLGTLTISDAGQPNSAPTPEPCTILLVGTGILVGVVRRRICR